MSKKDGWGDLPAMQRDRQMLHLRVLGGFELAGPDGPIFDISGRKQKALMGYLAIAPGMAESREVLADLLWSDRGDAQARSSLRQCIASLKRDLGTHSDVLNIERGRVGLRSGRIACDAAILRQLAAAGDSRAAADILAGRFLEGLSVNDQVFEDWIGRERQQFDEIAIQVCEALAGQLSGYEAVEAARKLLALDPLREASHRVLMRALVAAGERDKALRQFEACRKMLSQEFGVEPAAQTCQVRDSALAPAEPTQAVRAVALSVPVLVQPDSTTVAVLPFVNQSGDEAQTFFVEGIGEDLITELARYRHLTVIGHRLSSRYGARRGDIEGMRLELGADFVVDGSVRLAGNRVRVAVKLIDAENGEHVWGDRFDREMLDIFAVQDEIVGAVLAKLALTLDEAAKNQRQRDQTSSSSAYACFLKARAHWRKGEASRAMQCALQAVDIDPGYGRALACVAHFYAYSLFSQWTGLDERETMERAMAALEKSVAADRSDPFILQRAAMSYSMLGHPNAAYRYVEAAAIDSACDSEILVVRGLVHACYGRHRDGIEMLERAVELERRLSPGCYAALSEVRHVCGDYAGSLAALEGITDPRYEVRLIQAVNLARLGNIEEARRIIAEAPEDFDTARSARSHARMYARQEDSEHWLESFRLAGATV